MWSYVFGFFAAFFFALAVFIFCAAGKEFNRRDAEWRNILGAKQQLLEAKERVASLWIDNYETERDKLKIANNTIVAMTSQIRALQQTASLQMSKVTELESVANSLKKRSKEKRDDSASASSSSSSSPSRFTRNLECVICLESAPMTICIPCGHISTCVSCSKCMDSPACPICRAIGSFYSVYDATKAVEEEGLGKTEKKDLHPDEVTKRKGLIRRFLDRF